MQEKETLLDKLGRLVNIVANAVLMNVMFLVACLPIVTIGAAWSALFSAVRYQVRGEKWFEGFKVGYKTRFWRSLISGVIMLIPIVFVLYFDVVVPLATPEYVANLKGANLTRLIAACVMGLMLTGFHAALILLNVYIPTSVSNWLSNASKLFFKVPLQLALAGAIMWFPPLLALLSFTYFFYFSMVFLVAYFMLGALGITMLMKDALLDCLLDARAEGILTDEREEESEERSDEENVENQKTK